MRRAQGSLRFPHLDDMIIEKGPADFETQQWPLKVKVARDGIVVIYGLLWYVFSLILTVVVGTFQRLPDSRQSAHPNFYAQVSIRGQSQFIAKV
ncbi:hypothetical protein ACHAWF_018106 [Thalassiosira exigua]